MPKIKSTLKLNLRKKFTAAELQAIEILENCHFEPNEDGVYPVNHKDGNRQNNRTENLEWLN